MSTKKQIVVEVSETGEITIETVGYKGAACEAATKAIEAALGVAGARKRKPEWYQTEQSVNAQRA